MRRQANRGCPAKHLAWGASRRLMSDKVDPRNAASIKTLERLGFQREGYLRERWQVSGEIQDAYFYGLLRPEWVGKTGDR